MLVSNLRVGELDIRKPEMMTLCFRFEGDNWLNIEVWTLSLLYTPVSLYMLSFIIYYIIAMIHIIHMAVADQEICVCVVFCVPKNSTISPPFLSRLSQAALPPDRYLGHPEGASDL